MSQKSLKVKEFQQLTNCTDKLANQYLNSNNWDLNYALNEYYDQELGGFVNEVSRKYPQELVSLFDRYSSVDEGLEGIDAEGLMKFIEDLGYELEDLITLCLGNLMNCKNLVEPITRNQFLDSWFEKNCSTIEQMKIELSGLDEKLHLDLNYFTYIYKYAFLLISESKQKQVMIETAIEYWNLFFNKQYPLHISTEQTENWTDFIKQSDKRSLTKDEWQMILEFFKKYPTLKELKDDYDPMDAWPYIIDEYYEFLEDLGKV